MKNGYVPPRFMVAPSPDVTRALAECADAEGRDPREQAALLIAEGLQARGYLGAGDDGRVVLYLSGDRAGELVEALKSRQ